MRGEQEATAIRGGRWTKRAAAALGSNFLAIVTTLACLAIAEAVFRAVDGFRIASVRLIRNPASPPTAEALLGGRNDAATRNLGAVPLAPGMKREWFDLAPPDYPRPPVPAVLTETYKRYTEAEWPSEAEHVYNWTWARHRLCVEPYLKDLPGYVFAFDAPNGSTYPAYRFPRNVTTPTELTTNQFGWRGPPVELRKPERTIRIAFLGASTTVNSHQYRFSYPELAGFWLNKWVTSQDHGVRIEVINAGREAATSSDMAAIFRDELIPVEPDLVVYYEGHNQFWPQARELIRYRAGSEVRRRLLGTLKDGAKYSAAIARLRTLLRGMHSGPEEPPKLSYDLVWPDGVDEADPPLSSSDLPISLPVILRDLEDIRQRAKASGAELVLSSYFWLVRDGMRLHDQVTFEYINERLYPLRYRDLERLAKFENRTFEKFARVHGLPFIDFARLIPQDPALYWDPVHATYEGARLQGWIAAQQLAPVLQARIEKGLLPRPAQRTDPVHPAFVKNERTVSMDCSRRPRNARGDEGFSTYADGLAVPPR